MKRPFWYIWSFVGGTYWSCRPSLWLHPRPDWMKLRGKCPECRENFYLTAIIYGRVVSDDWLIMHKPVTAPGTFQRATKQVLSRRPSYYQERHVAVCA